MILKVRFVTELLVILTRILFLNIIGREAVFAIEIERTNEMISPSQFLFVYAVSVYFSLVRDSICLRGQRFSFSIMVRVYVC